MLKNTIKAENITKGLCEFADKFDIQPLVKICADHYRTSININNLLETMKIGEQKTSVCKTVGVNNRV